MEIRLLWEILCDRWRVLAVCVAASIIFTFLFLLAYPNVYQSTAYLQVKKVSESSLFLKDVPKEVAAISYFDQETVLGSLELFMKNESLIQQVIEKSGLKDKVSFSPSKFADPGKISLAFRKRGVAIEAEKDSEVFSITGLSVDIEEAKLIANTFLNEFFNYFSNRRRVELQRAKAGYLDKVKALKENIEDMETMELEFRKKNLFFDFGLQQQNLLTRLNDLKIERYNLETEMASKVDIQKEVLKAIARNPEYLKASENISSNHMIEFYKQEIADLKGMIASLSKQKTPEHPDIINLNEQIFQMERLMGQEKEKIFSNLVTSRNDFYDSLIEKKENYAIDIARIQSTLKSNKKDAAAVSREMETLLELNDRFTRLTRNLSNLRSVHTGVDQAIKLLEAAESIDFNSFLLFNYAQAFGKERNYLYMPNKVLFLLLFGSMGFFGGLFLIFILEYIGDSPRLFETFLRLMSGYRCVEIRNDKGWPLLTACLEKTENPRSVAVLDQYRKKDDRGGFSSRLFATVKNDGRNPSLICMVGEGDSVPKTEDSKCIFLSEVAETPKAALKDLEDAGHRPVIMDYPPFSKSSAGYRAGELCDVLLYVVHRGGTSISDIQTDVRYFSERGWADRVIAVFYNKPWNWRVILSMWMRRKDKLIGVLHGK